MEFYLSAVYVFVQRDRERERERIHHEEILTGACSNLYIDDALGEKEREIKIVK